MVSVKVVLHYWSENPKHVLCSSWVIVWQMICFLLCCLKLLKSWYQCSSKVKQIIALASGLLQAALGDQAVCTYLAGNSHSVSHGILQCCGTSLSACLFRNKAAVQVLPALAHTHTHTRTPILFLNQMCFYWVQFRFPRCYKYALGCSELPAFWGGNGSLLWLVCRPAYWLVH